jgi:hypothetical protein
VIVGVPEAKACDGPGSVRLSPCTHGYRGNAQIPLYKRDNSESVLTMTKREARRIALRLAYEAVQKAVDGGGKEVEDFDDQRKIDEALDEIAQRMFERWHRIKQ